MSVNISKFPDKDVPPYTKNFAEVANANRTVLDITEEDITSITDKTTALENSIANVVAKETALKEAVQQKYLFRGALEEVIKDLTYSFQKNKAVTDALRAALNITIKDIVPSPLVTHQPQELDAEALASGTVRMNWRKGENKYGVDYVIEMRKEGQAEFQFVDQVRATKYDHKGQKPGEFKIYRIKARKGDAYSEPSNEASVYSAEMKV